MHLQELINDYLTFTRNERIALLVICCITLTTVFLPGIIGTSANSLPYEIDSSGLNAIQIAENNKPENRTKYINRKDERGSQFENRGLPVRRQLNLFYFDPNTLTYEGWKELGLTEKNIKTILNYRKKGGYFYKAEDLKKIYGLNQKDYESIVPFVKIIKLKDEKKQIVGKDSTGFTSQSTGIKNFRHFSIIDINSADTTSFISLPGIGSKLAARIVIFREKLGGFYSINQVSETFGLPDSTFQKVKVYLEIKNHELRKININEATIDELKAHPYIKWNLANPLIAYRNEHGAFSSIEEIKKIPSVSNELFTKIAPYLVTQ